MIIKRKLVVILVIATVFLSLCIEEPADKTSTLTIDNLVFCTEVLQNGEYTPRSDAEFSSGEPIHVYFELNGVGVTEEDDKYAVSLKWEYLKLYKEGTLVDEKYNVLSYDQSFDTDVSYVWMSRPIEISELGTCSVEVNVIDNYTGETVSSTGSFTITSEDTTSTPTSTPSATEQDFDVTYYYFPKVPSATYHLFGGIYASYVDVEMVNNNNHEVRTKVEVQIMSFTDASFQTVDIPANDSGVVSLTPPLLPNVLDLLAEQKRTNFHIKVTYIEHGDEKLIFEDTVPVTMLAKRDMVLWMENVDFRKNIAAWVTPNDPAIDEFFSVAKTYMPGGTFAGYLENEEGVLNQLDKIYYTLKEEYDIAYVSTPNFRIYNNGEDVIQRIRFPSETLKNGIGNCIETTVLFASICESLQLNTVIVLRPGHAYVGVETQEGSGIYWFIETTLFGSDDVTFYDALDIGSNNFDEDKPHIDNNEESYRLIFIDVCRDDGISPIEG
ncbi:MAG: hypothetical protein U9N35_06535 [Euryarchaeota archaeon]|nr:hypothetical protein [Euryarchaeota archaeon]